MTILLALLADLAHGLRDWLRMFATRPRFLALAAFLFAGDVKASPALAWLPGDLTLITGGLLALVILVRVLRGWKTPSLRPLALAGLWFLTFLPGVIQAVDSDYGFQKIVTLFTFTLLAALAPIFLVDEEEDVLRLMNALAVFCLVIAAQGLLGVLAGGHRTLRLEAFGAGTISLGRASGLLFIYGVILLMRRSPLAVLTFGLIALAGTTAFFSGSRGPLVAALAVLGLLFTLGRQKLGLLKVKLLLAAGLLAVVLGSSLSLAPEGSLRRVEYFAQGQYGPSERYRVTALETSWSYLKAAPLGLGWGGFGTHVNPLNGLGRQYAHNLVAEVTLESGWLAGAYTLVILAMAGLAAWSRTAHPWGRVAFAGLVFYLINSLVSGDVNDNRPLFTFVTVALMLLNRPLEVSRG